MRKVLYLLFILLYLSQSLAAQENNNSYPFPDYPEVKFIVFSDPHYYDPSLGIEGKAFQQYLDRDRKLLRESRQLLEELVSFIEKTEANFVLIPGDLTKDGEKVNHMGMAAFLKRIKDSGKKVFVVPGNHDVNIPAAYRFDGDQRQRVPTVFPEEFAEIYAPYGYGDAVRRDEFSLSYVAEPIEGLWLLAMDACRYNENPEEGQPITGGRFNKETLAWLESILEEGLNQGKAMIGMLHHGVLEHYKGQKKHFGEYLVDDHRKVSALLANYGVRLVFTGHYHAQDITMKSYRNGKFILDIQTGSPVTYPCPYRIVKISPEQNLTIESRFITSIPSNPDFAYYARNYVHSGISGIAAKTLIDMNVDSTEAHALSGQVADAFIAHYKGDEIEPEKPFDLSGISLRGRFLIGFRKNLVKNLYKDLYPEDNFLQMPLR